MPWALEVGRWKLALRHRIDAVASEQFPQVFAYRRLDQMRIETRVEARVADVRTHVASESDQIELLWGKPLPQMTSEVNPAHPRQ